MYTLELLADFYQSECSDPHDKVYSFLGIAWDGVPEYDSVSLLVAGAKVGYAKAVVDFLADCLKLHSSTTFTLRPRRESLENSLLQP